ncbi:MAG: hypothetical protein J6T49_06060, partial [Bacteroidales bacterium]|nr:hypothetical protein [Bacteroidales bacterium]
MKRFLTLLISVLFCFDMAAQEGYHNSKVGSTLKWVIHDGSGALFGYCHETLTRLDGDMQNARIDYSYMFYDKDNESVTGDKPFEFYVTIEKGKTRAYVNNVLKAKQSGDYMTVGDISSIPDNLYVGQNLLDSEIQVKVLT